MQEKNEKYLQAPYRCKARGLFKNLIQTHRTQN